MAGRSLLNGWNQNLIETDKKEPVLIESGNGHIMLGSKEEKNRAIISAIRECFVRNQSKQGKVCPQCESFWHNGIECCPLCSCRTLDISIGGA